MASQTPRLRFCPSPTGTPHVGLMRTALFNYAYAQHIGGELVFRIEDTDAARDSEESYHQIIDALTWLGIRWDEGPDIGGPYGPYRQSERTEIYREVLAKLVAAQLVYESFSTADEIRQRHLDAGRRPELGYDNYDRNLSEQEIAEFKRQGKPSVLRLRMPDHELAWDDLIRGRTVFAPGSVPDFPLTRANGQPLYAFVNVVDDALMKITHILRGEDLLPSTPRQLALYEALQSVGICDASPQYAHLPYVMGAGNKKLSKRDPEASFFAHRDRGFIAEGLVNYLALLGWGYSHDEDIFSLAQMIEKFDIHDVNANPARFDQKKADAINAEHIRQLSVDDCADRINNFLVAKGLLTKPSDVVTQITPFIRTRITVLNDVWPLISFLFVSEEEFSYAEKAVTKNFTPDAIPVLQAAYEALAVVEQWDDATITEVLHNALVTELNLSPKQAFGSVRVAITGAVVSPPLFESIRVLGKSKSLARLRSAIEYIESHQKKEASNS